MKVLWSYFSGRSKLSWKFVQGTRYNYSYCTEASQVSCILHVTIPLDFPILGFNWKLFYSRRHGSVLCSYKLKCFCSSVALTYLAYQLKETTSLTRWNLTGNRYLTQNREQNVLMWEALSEVGIQVLSRCQTNVFLPNTFKHRMSSVLFEPCVLVKTSTSSLSFQMHSKHKTLQFTDGKSGRGRTRIKTKPYEVLELVWAETRFTMEIFKLHKFHRVCLIYWPSTICWSSTSNVYPNASN